MYLHYVCIIIDANIMAKSGKRAIAAELAREYNFTENDGNYSIKMP